MDVEDELVAIAVLGDVTVDLSDPTNIPTEVRLKAYALGRDVDVLVASGTQVELSGRSHNDHLNNEVPSVPEVECSRVLRIEATLFLATSRYGSLTRVNVGAMRADVGIYAKTLSSSAVQIVR